MTAVSSIYRLFFVDLQREKKEFDKEQVLSFIKRKCNVPEQKNVFNENTVKKDIRVLLQNYLAPTSPKGYEEYASILLELGLLRENEGKYSFNEISIEQVNPLIILFALVHIAGEDKTVSFDKLQELSLIFCIPTSSFLMVVRSLSEQYPKEISYTDNSGIITTMKFNLSINISQGVSDNFNYIVTPNAQKVYGNIVDSFQSGIHSFLIIGTYGTGKSSFLMALEQDLLNNKSKLVSERSVFADAKSFEFMNIVGDYSSLSTLLSKELSIAPSDDSKNVFSTLTRYLIKLKDQNNLARYLNMQPTIIQKKNYIFYRH